MKKSNLAKAIYSALVVASVFGAGVAQACGPNCTNDVNVTKITNTTTLETKKVNIDASAEIAGNNLVAPSPNNGATGTYNNGDGMFNGVSGVSYDPLKPGVPGWFLLGTENVTYGKKGHYSYSFTTAPILGQNLVDPSWFTANGFEGGIPRGESGESGTWGFNLPANLLTANPAIADLFNGHLFDQFSLVLFGDTTDVYTDEKQCSKYYDNGTCRTWQKVKVKTGSNTPYMAYDFTAEDLGLSVSAATIFDFSGVWSSCFNVTSIGLYVRDPATESNVPEPGSVLLIGLGLAALGLRRRKTTNH